jgi:hypothetical protein
VPGRALPPYQSLRGAVPGLDVIAMWFEPMRQAYGVPAIAALRPMAP